MYRVDVDYDNDTFQRIYEGEDLDLALAALNAELMMDRQIAVAEDDELASQPMLEYAHLYRINSEGYQQTVLEIDW